MKAQLVIYCDSSADDGTRRGASKGSSEAGKERGNVPKPPCRRGGGPLGRPRRGTHRSPRGSAPGEGDTLESASDRVQGWLVYLSKKNQSLPLSLSLFFYFAALQLCFSHFFLLWQSSPVSVRLIRGENRLTRTFRFPVETATFAKFQSTWGGPWRGGRFFCLGEGRDHSDGCLLACPVIPLLFLRPVVLTKLRWFLCSGDHLKVSDEVSFPVFSCFSRVVNRTNLLAPTAPVANFTCFLVSVVLIYLPFWSGER